MGTSFINDSRIFLILNAFKITLLCQSKEKSDSLISSFWNSNPSEMIFSICSSFKVSKNNLE